MKKKNKKFWMLSATKSSKGKPSESDKKSIQDYFHPLVESFKEQYISKKPSKDFSYLIDVYSKWFRDYFYLCEKYKSVHPNRLADEFEVKIVRLKYKGTNLFEFSYFRHTGQWHLVADNLTLVECKEMILSNPVFQPIG